MPACLEVQGSRQVCVFSFECPRPACGSSCCAQSIMVLGRMMLPSSSGPGVDFLGPACRPPYPARSFILFLLSWHLLLLLFTHFCHCPRPILYFSLGMTSVTYDLCNHPSPQGPCKSLSESQSVETESKGRGEWASLALPLGFIVMLTADLRVWLH